jgi:hypothetical protein
LTPESIVSDEDGRVRDGAYQAPAIKINDECWMQVFEAQTIEEVREAVHGDVYATTGVVRKKSSHCYIMLTSLICSGIWTNSSSCRSLLL